MARTTFRPNLAGFAQLRNHPALVGAMESAAHQAAGSAPFDVEVVTWPHQGRQAGPRTSVQIWARSPRARAVLNRDPSILVNVLSRARV